MTPVSQLKPHQNIFNGPRWKLSQQKSLMVLSGVSFKPLSNLQWIGAHRKRNGILSFMSLKVLPREAGRMNIHFICPLIAFRTLPPRRQHIHHFLSSFALKAKQERHTLRFVKAERPQNKSDVLISPDWKEMYLCSLILSPADLSPQPVGAAGGPSSSDIRIFHSETLNLGGGARFWSGYGVKKHVWNWRNPKEMSKNDMNHIKSR